MNSGQLASQLHVQPVGQVESPFKHPEWEEMEAMIRAIATLVGLWLRRRGMSRRTCVAPYFDNSGPTVMASGEEVRCRVGHNVVVAHCCYKGSVRGPQHATVGRCSSFHGRSCQSVAAVSARCQRGLRLQRVVNVMGGVAWEMHIQPR